MRPLPRILSTTLALAALVGAGPATGDTVRLTNGRSLDGRAVVLDNGDVELYSSMGMIRLPAHKVDTVERSQTIESRVAEVLEGLGRVTADDLYELGVEARQEGASTLAQRLFGEALRIDPDHEATRRLLGYVRTDEGWRLAQLVPEPRRPSADEVERSERIALLRSLRAQADAARAAELRRIAALEAQARRRHRQESSRGPGLDDDRVVATVIPQFVPGTVFLPAPQPRARHRPQRQGEDTARATPRRTPRSRRERDSNPSTLVRIPPP